MSPAAAMKGGSGSFSSIARVALGTAFKGFLAAFKDPLDDISRCVRSLVAWVLASVLYLPYRVCDSMLQKATNSY